MFILTRVKKNRGSFRQIATNPILGTILQLDKRTETVKMRIMRFLGEGHYSSLAERN